MNTNGLVIKLFVGFQVTAELRMHLKESHAWKEAKIQPEFQPLIETHYEHLHYVGKFMASPLPLGKLRAIEQELKKTLLVYCPKFPAEKLNLFTFSQVFIA